MSADSIAEEHDISRSYVYKLETQAEGIFNTIVENSKLDCVLLPVDSNFIRKNVLSLSMNCHASYEGIQRHLEDVCHVHISIGEISNIINEACILADDINKSIDLSKVKQTANDEIFQGNKPVLTTVDLLSSYIVNMNPSEDRSGSSWENLMEERKLQGLDIEVSVSDGGSGLLCGIPKAFPKSELRMDVFHAERALGIEVSKLERAAYAEIEDEHKKIKAVSGKKVHKKTVKALEELQSHIDDDIWRTDQILTLYQWSKELLGFCGCSADEVIEALHWICQQMLEIIPDRKLFRKQVHVFEDHIEQTVGFLHYLQKKMADEEQKYGYKPGSMMCLYRARSYQFSQDSMQEWQVICDLAFDYNCDQRSQAEKVLESLIDITYRASSMVENVNGRIRDYIDAKRSVPPMYFALIQLYMNTKKYRRSEVKERIGKSPLELLTGKSHPSFYQLLGIE